MSQKGLKKLEECSSDQTFCVVTMRSVRSEKDLETKRKRKSAGTGILLEEKFHSTVINFVYLPIL